VGLDFRSMKSYLESYDQIVLLKIFVWRGEQEGPLHIEFTSPVVLYA
jgi:hypothetical protein